MSGEYQRARLSHRGKFTIILAIVLLSAGSVFCQTSGAGNPAPPAQSSGQDKKETKSSDATITKLRILVTGGDKPVGNASVYVKYNEPGGLFHREKLAEMSFKTNEDGSVKVPEVPRGRVLIQVIAKGWHTYGKWYDIETEGQTIEIKLEEPHHWY
ncbi:MAG: hypothetical protein WB780_24570 [Candidatus Acidiferrales bacterium]